MNYAGLMQYTQGLSNNPYPEQNSIDIYFFKIYFDTAHPSTRKPS
jgi:hypothetical protein